MPVPQTLKQRLRVNEGRLRSCGQPDLTLQVMVEQPSSKVGGQKKKNHQECPQQYTGTQPYSVSPPKLTSTSGWGKAVLPCTPLQADAGGHFHFISFGTILFLGQENMQIFILQERHIPVSSIKRYIYVFSNLFRLQMETICYSSAQKIN